MESCATVIWCSCASDRGVAEDSCGSGCGGFAKERAGDRAVGHAPVRSKGRTVCRTERRASHSGDGLADRCARHGVGRAERPARGLGRERLRTLPGHRAPRRACAPEPAPPLREAGAAELGPGRGADAQRALAGLPRPCPPRVLAVLAVPPRLLGPPRVLGSGGWVGARRQSKRAGFVLWSFLRGPAGGLRARMSCECSRCSQGLEYQMSEAGKTFTGVERSRCEPVGKLNQRCFSSSGRMSKPTKANRPAEVA